MVYSLSKRTSFSMLIASDQLFRVPIHFFGRSLLCSGEPDCRGCDFFRPKNLWYFAATVARHLEVIECCDSLARVILDRQSTLMLDQAKGLILRGHRKTVRAMWSVDEVGHRPELACVATDAIMKDSIAQLFQLPYSRGEASLASWHETVKRLHQPVLAKCVVPV